MMERVNRLITFSILWALITTKLPNSVLTCKSALKNPEYPIRSLAEAFYQLRKSLGLHSVNALMAISAGEYRTDKFVIGIDTEKVLGASFSGYNSKASDLTVLRLKPAYANTITTAGNLKLHYVLHYDSIVQVNDQGIVLE